MLRPIISVFSYYQEPTYEYEVVSLFHDLKLHAPVDPRAFIDIL